MAHYFIDKGETCTGIILDNSYMYITSGGVANSTTVNSDCRVYVYSSGVANNTTVSAGGWMNIYAGGMVNNTTVNDGGFLGIDSGGVASNITAISGARLRIEVASNTYIQGTYNGSAFEMKDAQISGYTVNFGDYVCISSGGVANSTTVNGGSMQIFSSGVANSTTVNRFGSMCISSGGVVNCTTVNSGGSMCISSGGVANNTIVNGEVYYYDDGGRFTWYSDVGISSGGVANNTTINDWGLMLIGDGGVANSTTVNSHGSMFISSGGCAIEIVENGGYVRVDEGANVTFASNTINGLTLSAMDNMTVHSNTMANSTTINEWGAMYISSGGVANSTTMSGGWMYISSGGTANSTTVNDFWGSMFISSGGVANSTTFNSGGDMYISSGGTANSTLLTGGGDYEHACMYIYDGGVANSTTVNSRGYMYISSGGVANSTTINEWGAMCISSGGVANSTTVNSLGYMYICSGGVANSTTVSNGKMSISSGGVANSTTLNSSSVMWISSGGVANNTTVNGRQLSICSGGTANSTTLNSSGIMLISSGGEANNTMLNSAGRMYIYSGGTANSTTVMSGGAMYISSGGTATNIIDSSGAKLGITVASNTYIQGTSNGSAFEMKNAYISGYTVDGGGYISIISGGTANSTTVNNGYMYISSGGVHRGSLDITNGATVSAYVGAVIDFTVADRKASDGYLINNLSLIQGTPTYTITVAADQASGTYKLAQGASKFSGSITIGDGTTDYGSITVNGDIFTYNEVDYLLTCEKGNLKLTIGDIDNVKPTEEEYLFISSKYTEKITGKKQNGVLLEYKGNAFCSITDVPEADGKLIVAVDGKVNGNEYAGDLRVAANAVLPKIKETDNSYSYKANAATRGTLNITASTGKTEFIRFGTVNVAGEGVTVKSVSAGKSSSSENLKHTVNKKGVVTDTEKFSYTANVAGKFTAAANATVESVSSFSKVALTNATVKSISGGNTKETTNSKLVDSTTKDQKVISTVNNNIAAGSVTLKNQAKADTISGYSNVTITDSTVGDVTNFTSKDSKSETATYDEAKNTVTRKVTLSHTETTAGTLKATNSTIGDVTGFATVTLQNVTEAGDFRRVDADGDVYSTVKESLNIKTDKKGVVTGSYTRTETFTRAGKFTAAGSTVGDVENFSNVTLDGSKAEDISNFVEAKIVTTGTAIWDNTEAYGRPEDYAIDLQGWNKEKPIVTKPLNGSVTLKNGASADSIENFKSVTMTGSEVVGTIKNVEKVTVNKGDSSIGSYTGTDGNDTLSIAKGAVLTANKIDLGKGDKDKLAINGTLILTGTEIKAANITGKGEIAVVDSLFDDVSVNFANLLNVGVTADNFRGTAYENADDSAKKAVKWDGKTEYNGWLGDWSGAKEGSDTVDYIKFKAAENAQLTVSGDVDWTLLDKKGNDIGKEITVAGEYTIKLNHDEGTSISYQIKLA